MFHISRALLICAATSTVSALAVAAPPATSPYVTDPQNLSVQDETAQGIDSLNMVLCVIGSMDPRCGILMIRLEYWCGCYPGDPVALCSAVE